MSTQPDPRGGLGPRASAIADWISHHLELLPLGGGIALAVATSPVWLIPTSALAALWAAHERRATRHNTRAELTAAPATERDAAEPEKQPADDIPIAHPGH